VPENLFDYSTMAQAPASADIDEAYNFWSVFNPTTTTDLIEAPGAFVYNEPPQDWNAEFSLTFGVELNTS
jgi:hypothetical protein